MRWKRRLTRSAPAPSEVRSEINVTPLVDVVLVLLIIFMVVTPLLTRAVKVELPRTRHHEQRHDTGEAILVSVTREGAIFVGADPVTLEALPAALQRALTASDRRREVQLRGDQHLRYGQVRRVLEVVHAAGATQVAMGTEARR